jgi:hypothetical protein
MRKIGAEIILVFIIRHQGAFFLIIITGNIILGFIVATGGRQCIALCQASSECQVPPIRVGFNKAGFGA